MSEHYRILTGENAAEAYLSRAEPRCANAISARAPVRSI